MQTPITIEEQPEVAVSTSLRALAAIACRLGLDVSVDQLRRRFALPTGEPDTPTLIALAHELGLEAQAMRMSFQELPRVARALPAILRAKDGGALILEEARTDPAKGTVAVIRDPSSPEDLVLAIDELHLAEVWEGEAILIKRRHSASDEEQPFGMRWLFGQVIKERKLFSYIVYAAIVSTIFAVAPPFVFRIVLDRVLVHNSYATLNILVGAILFLLVFETVLTYLRGILTEVVSTRIDGRISLFVADRLLKLPMDYFERTPTGRILSKLNNIWLIRHFLTGQLFGTFLDAVPLLALIPLMMFIEWHLALMALALAGIIAVIVMIFIKPMHRAYHRVVVAEHAKNQHLSETIYGIKTVKSLALEGRRRREWDHRVAEQVAARYEFGILANYPKTLTLPFDRLIYSGCLAVGAYMVLYQTNLVTPGVSTLLNVAPTISAGELVAFAMLSMRLGSPLVKMAMLQMDLAEVRGAIIEVASVVNVVPEASRTNGMRLPIKGNVSFNNVRFRSRRCQL